MSSSFFDDDQIPDEIKAKMLLALIKMQKCHDAKNMRSVLNLMLTILDEAEKIDNKESQ